MCRRLHVLLPSRGAGSESGSWRRRSRRGNERRRSCGRSPTSTCQSSSKALLQRRLTSRLVDVTEFDHTHRVILTGPKPQLKTGSYLSSDVRINTVERIKAPSTHGTMPQRHSLPRNEDECTGSPAAAFAKPGGMTIHLDKVSKLTLLGSLNKPACGAGVLLGAAINSCKHACRAIRVVLKKIVLTQRGSVQAFGRAQVGESGVSQWGCPHAKKVGKRCSGCGHTGRRLLQRKHSSALT